MSIMYKEVRVMPGSKGHDLLTSKDPEDLKKAKLLYDYCRKAEACNYDYAKIQELRKHYSDVI